MKYVELYLEKLGYYSDVQLDGPKIVGLGLCFVADAISKGLAGKRGIAPAIDRLTEALKDITLEVSEEDE
jgi:hypothetical protein